MGRYILRRLALAVPVLFLVSAIIFAIIRVIPGDVVTLKLMEGGESLEAVAIRTQLGLDRTYIVTSPWIAFFPGLTLSLLVLGIDLLGDTLRDVLDPRLRRR